MADKETLKPCPFCGSTSLRIMYKEAYFYGWDLWNGTTTKHQYRAYVRCNKCFSRGKPISFIHIKGKPNSKIKLHEHDNEAIEAWNRRVNND